MRINIFYATNVSSTGYTVVWCCNLMLGLLLDIKSGHDKGGQVTGGLSVIKM